MHQPNHPIWAIFRILAITLAAYVVLLATSTNYDNTERLAILGVVLAAIGAETATKFMSKTN